jgi:hypothetical protein
MPLNINSTRERLQAFDFGLLFIEELGWEPPASRKVESGKVKDLAYEDYREAIRLVQRWPDTSRVGAVDSFTRFSKLLTGNAKAAFQQCGDACADLVHQAAQMGRA